MTIQRNPATSLALATAVMAALSSTGAYAADAGDWLVRGSVAHVSPNEDTSNVSGPLSGALSGSEVKVDSQTGLGFTGAYFLTDQVAVELLASAPFKHDLSISGGTLGGNELGSVKHLPPTLSAQYHFDTGTAFRPYVGLGVNYTIFFDEEVNSDVGARGVNEIDIDNSLGLAGQVGVDYALGDGWLVNAGVRYLDIQAETDISAAGSTSVDVDIDPWVSQAGIGYRF